SLISIRFNLSNEQLFDKIIESINIKEDINDSKDKKEKWERIYFFKSLLLESNDYKETLNQLYLDSNDNNSKGVNLLTIHKAKGLEFKAVFIVGCNEGILPMKNADIEEERRLMYVAITRTKDFLLISSSCLLNDSLTKKSLKNSLFICEIIHRIKRV
nr:ATP-binding domain-containing protein [Acholeplasmatales bacterium]